MRASPMTVSTGGRRWLDRWGLEPWWRDCGWPYSCGTSDTGAGLVRDLPGAAGDQPGRHDAGGGRRAVPVQAVEQDPRGKLTHPFDVLGDDGDPGAQHVGQREVVEPDHRHLVLPADRPQR